jgi:hypothetical protein
VMVTGLWSVVVAGLAGFVASALAPALALGVLAAVLQALTVTMAIATNANAASLR